MDFTAVAEHGANKRVLLWLGFGLFVVTYGGGPLGFVSGPTGHDFSWDSILLVQTSFMLGTALGCLGMKLAARQGDQRRGQVAGALAYIATALLCWAAQPVLAAIDVQTGTAVRGVLSLLVGAIYAQPLLFWVGQFLDLSRTCDRLGFIAAFVPCYALSVVAMGLVSFLDGVPYVYSLLHGGVLGGVGPNSGGLLPSVRAVRAQGRRGCERLPPHHPLRLGARVSGLLMGNRPGRQSAFVRRWLVCADRR
ncbi:hypothetical protein [Arabiibacter massiliensis]|uniref:hypothetical protein n=1 Tax=Arabiibacter massiliensis TaxID=1870985 RepID=UPI00155B36C1|nr:hypothetical protein [Arabiibacter massiliensis]